MRALRKQVAGEHYKKGIQPWEYIEANNLDFFQGNVIKYVTRYKDKNGVEDLRKAQHYIEYLIERESVKLSKVSVRRVKKGKKAKALRNRPN